jgi:hypothetical protein
MVVGNQALPGGWHAGGTLLALCIEHTLMTEINDFDSGDDIFPF